MVHNPYPMRRIMLVSWRWLVFERAGKIVSSELLSKPEYASAISDVAAFRNELFDEFTVCEQQPDGTAPAVDPVALIVRTHIKRLVDQPVCLCCEYLERLIEYCQQEPTELLIFLHRRDGFTNENVSYFLPKIKTGRCFLIGGGRDIIYYHDKRNQGLLGEDGYFFRKNAVPGYPSVRVADREKKIVYLRYFEKVWAYYKHEFYTKVYELREDLLRHFYQLDLRLTIQTNEDLAAHLALNKVLSLRLASFIDDEDSKLSPTQKDDLDKYGKDAAKSYEFDDLKANLAAKEITTEYTHVSNLLHQYFHASDERSDETTLSEPLVTINKAFIALLEKMKDLK